MTGIASTDMSMTNVAFGTPVSVNGEVQGFQQSLLAPACSGLYLRGQQAGIVGTDRLDVIAQVSWWH